MSAPTTKKSRITTADRLDSGIVRLCQVAEGLAQLLDKQQARDRDVPEKQETRAPINEEPHPEYLQKQLYGILEEREKRYSEQLRNLQRRLEVLERDREAIVSAEIERRMRPPAEQGNCATGEIRKERGFADVFEGRRAGLAGRY